MHRMDGKIRYGLLYVSYLEDGLSDIVSMI